MPITNLNETLPMPEKERAMLPLIDVKDGLKLVMVALPKGGAVPPHQAPYLTSVQLIEGRIEVLKDTTWMTVNPGDRVVFDPNQTHGVQALEASYFLVSHMRGLVVPWPS